MITIGKSNAALNFICDCLTLQAQINSLFIYNNLKIEGDFIYNGRPVSEAEDLFGLQFILGAVMPETKRKLVELFDKNYVTISHPSAILSRGAEIGNGCLIGENTTICGGSKIGKYVTVYCNSSINHDCEIGDYVTICPGVTICGDVKIGEGSFIGAGSVIKNGVTIGKNCVIGMGSVVLNDVEDNQTVYGNPAK